MMAENLAYQDLILRIRELEDNEKILKEKTDRLESAIDAVEDGVWEWDPRTGNTYFSPRWFSMLGFEPGELPATYETWVNLLHPDDRDDAVNTVVQFLERPENPFSIEFRMRTKDGGWRWIHARGKTIARDREGKVSRMVGTHVDITDRRRLEHSLRLTQFIYEKASIGIYRIAADARILEVNNEAARSLGYSREELTSMRIFDIDPSTGSDNWGTIWQRLLDGGGDKFETTHRHRDGTEFPVYITSNLLEYDSQQFSIAFVQDITHLKRMEQALSQAQKMEAIGNLAGGIAHDFNNVLSAIYGFAQLAQLEEIDNAKVRECIRHICLGSERAKELVLQILAFSRKGISEKRPTDIGKITKEALKLLRASIPSTIEIRDNIATDSGVVVANLTQIHQVVMNLCTNAAHALGSRGGRIVVELLPVEIGPESSANYQGLIPGSYLKLIVADNGHGIDPAHLPRIFEPYFTTKGLGEGTGMGLATVHGIVRDHGGDIKVYSEPGIGTTFHVLFPVAGDPLLPINDEISEMPGGTERILFVDDEQSIVEIGKELLTRLGYTVDTRVDSRDCLEAFRAQPDGYDLVVTDYAMPGMDGEELITEIRKIRRTMPVILCTGFSTSILAKKLSVPGIDFMLMKPMTASDLAVAVRRALDSR